jgi:hypothetical protein
MYTYVSEMYQGNGYFISTKMKIRSNIYEHLDVQTPAATDGAVKAFAVHNTSVSIAAFCNPHRHTFSITPNMKVFVSR